MTSKPARGTSMDLSHEAIHLGKRFDGIRMFVPVPENAGVPDMTLRRGAPAYKWAVVDAKSQQIGFLSLYASDHSEKVAFWVYGEDRGRGRTWCFKNAPEFSSAIAENHLKDRPDAVIVASPIRRMSDEYFPDECFPGLDSDRDLVHVPITFDNLAPKPTVPSSGSSVPRKPVTLEMTPSSNPAPERALVAIEGVSTSGLSQPSTKMPSVPSPSATRARRPAEPTTAPERPTHTSLEAGRGNDNTLLPSEVLRHPPAMQMSTIRAADVEPQAVSWLWQGRIPLGKVTMIVGYPGICKSLLGTFLAATVSRGASWPVTGDLAPKGSVLMVSTEDDPTDTIVPRLQAAGAEREAVHLFQEVMDSCGRRSLDLTRDIEGLEQEASRLGDLRLIIFDPITACLGRANQNAAGDIRAVMMRLADFAARTGTAVVVISHLNKGGSRQAMMRATGSLAFIAVARVAFLVDKDPSDPDLRLLLPMKSNLGTDHQGQSFRVESVEIDAGLAPRLVFDNEPVPITADKVLNEVRGSKEGRPALEEAKDFLQSHLAEGAVPASDVLAAAKAAGISPASLRRAKNDLGITPKKSGMAGEWRWMLPQHPKALKSTEDAHSNTMSTFVADEHLRLGHELPASQVRADQHE
jgi:putative DNA primase/helicase